MAAFRAREALAEARELLAECRPALIHMIGVLSVRSSFRIAIVDVLARLDAALAKEEA